MASKTRRNVLNRIRRRNKQLPVNEQIKITKGTKTQTLKSIEKSLDTKLKLKKVGINTSNIKNLSATQRSNLDRLSASLRVGNKQAISYYTNRLAKQNRTTLLSASKRLSKVKGFGSIDYLTETLKKKSFSSKSKLLTRDARTVLNALINENYVEKTLEVAVADINEKLELQGYDPISYDEFEIDFTIGEINKIPAETKKLFVSMIDTPKDYFDDDVTSYEDIDFSD